MVRVLASLLLLAATLASSKVTHHARKRSCTPKVTVPDLAAPTTSLPTITASPTCKTKAATKTRKSKTKTKTKTRTGVCTRPTAPTTTIEDPPQTTETSPGGSTDPPSGSALLRNLLPVSYKSSSLWSTSPAYDDALPLNDNSLRVSKVTGGTTHKVVEAPDGKLAMEAVFKVGSIAPGGPIKGGFSFYAFGAKDLTQGDEILFSYSVFFERGFQFNKGGKLPGVYGGTSENESVSCSGGRKSAKCFSLRLMWRPGGAAELYAYLPPGEPGNEQGCHGGCPYGASIGRGAFTWKTGQWNTVAERVKLNDIGEANGEVEIFYNGKSVILLEGVTICTSAACRVRGLQCQTFFGGHTEEWASPKTQSAYFADWTGAIVS